MNASQKSNLKARKVSAEEVGRLIHSQWVAYRNAELHRREVQDRKH